MPVWQARRCAPRPPSTVGLSSRCCGGHTSHLQLSISAAEKHLTKIKLLPWAAYVQWPMSFARIGGGMALKGHFSFRAPCAVGWDCFWAQIRVWCSLCPLRFLPCSHSADTRGTPSNTSHMPNSHSASARCGVQPSTTCFLTSTVDDYQGFLI